MTKDKSIFIRNIYYMLSYAFTTLHQGGYESVETEEFENLHNLFACDPRERHRTAAEAGAVP